MCPPQEMLDREPLLWVEPWEAHFTDTAMGYFPPICRANYPSAHLLQVTSVIQSTRYMTLWADFWIMSIGSEPDIETKWCPRQLRRFCSMCRGIEIPTAEVDHAIYLNIKCSAFHWDECCIPVPVQTRGSSLKEIGNLLCLQSGRSHNDS